VRILSPLLIKKLIRSGAKTPDALASAKRKFSKKYGVPCPSNIDLLKTYHKLVKNKSIKKSARIENLLRVRPVRSLSGIVNISLLSKPYACPGKCLYCPQELGIPKSYVSGEPAVERAKKLKYDPYLQVRTRTEMLEQEGHPTDKIELRIVGGTWSYYPKKYQEWFIKKCFDACNKKSNMPQRFNEKAKHRVVGLSVETRPDFINPAEIQTLRNFGVTMVELGVQTVYDDVLTLNQRGHGVKETIEATKLLKDAGFKVLYQMMPNLPGSSLSRDLKTFKELFSNPDFQPDLLKIYPCVLLKEAPLYRWWKQKKYQPYADKQLINLMKAIKKIIPYYVRVQRIARDIPGYRMPNLRQVLAEKSQKEGWKCKCIRCREVKENYNPKEKLYLFRQDYPASGGKEIFLSFENKNRRKLYSLLRLRLTSQDRAVIREIHTFGRLHPLNYKGSAHVISPQHKGLGKKLVKEAERISKKEFGLASLAIIAAVGTRDYFRKLGYKLQKTYMTKNLELCSF
jgi:elongator complex protein 3